MIYDRKYNRFIPAQFAGFHLPPPHPVYMSKVYRFIDNRQMRAVLEEGILRRTDRDDLWPHNKAIFVSGIENFAREAVQELDYGCDEGFLLEIDATGLPLYAEHDHDIDSKQSLFLTQDIPMERVKNIEYIPPCVPWEQRLDEPP